MEQVFCFVASSSYLLYVPVHVYRYFVANLRNKMNRVERYTARVLKFLVASPIGRNDVISGPLRVVLLLVYLTSRDLRVDRAIYSFYRDG